MKDKDTKLLEEAYTKINEESLKDIKDEIKSELNWIAQDSPYINKDDLEDLVLNFSDSGFSTIDLWNAVYTALQELGAKKVSTTGGKAWHVKPKVAR